MPTLWILHGLVTPVLVVLLVQADEPRRNGLAATSAAVRALLTTRGGKFTLGAILAVLALNFGECQVDDALTRALGYTLAPRVRALEGDLVERAQSLAPAPLVPGLGVVYVCGYVAWLLAPAVALTRRGNRVGMAALLLAFLANYALALPFYLFFPVAEPPFSGVSDALVLIDTAFPGLTEEMRVGSAVDNCFPSLHISLTVSTLFLVGRHGMRRMLAVGLAMTVLISFSVLSLGIHWGLDVLAGIAFGLLCAFVGEALALPVLRRVRMAP